ncbi:MAG: hypothetical protein J5950_08790 [Clostridia bacterium]|nr:hypothetical protein [Clostridia bacterium]
MKIMKIEITEKGSDAFYRDLINIMLAASFIQKNHNYKIRDQFKNYKSLLIIDLVLLSFMILLGILFGFKTFLIICLIVLGLSTLLNVYMLYSIRRKIQTLSSEFRPEILTLDESGIELAKEGKEVMRNSWDNVAVVRISTECIAFIPASRAGIIFFVGRQYETEITAWLRESQPSLEII